MILLPFSNHSTDDSTALFQVLATSGCNSVNRVSQSESRIQILLQFDWMARFWLLQPDVARTWKSAVFSQKKTKKKHSCRNYTLILYFVWQTLTNSLQPSGVGSFPCSQCSWYVVESMHICTANSS